MTPLSIQVPFPVFQDRAGQPLENGYVWIGVANLNPQTNPVVAYFDAALTIVAPQPLRTLNGYISRAGTPAQIYVNAANYSLLVQDSKGSMVYNFPDGTGISPDACGVTYDPPYTGGVSYPVCEKLAQTVSVKDFGAVGDGVVDDTAAIQAAINAVDIGGTVYLFDGVFKTTEELLITKTISIVGEDCRIGNVVNPLLSKSCIYASSTTDAAAIRVDDCVGTFRNFIVFNNGGAVIVDGIRANGGNNSLKVYDMMIEGFHTGIRCTIGYYNIVDNTSIAYCDTGIRIDNCYNFVISALKVRCNDTPIYDSGTYGLRLLNGSVVSIVGSAIENFYTIAIDVGSNGTVNMFGTYFESPSTGSASEIVVLGTNASVTAIGCHVYLTHSERFITIDSGSSTGVRVFSKNNRIVYPTTTKTVEVYVPLAGDTTASWDVSGDNWQSPIGANVTYLTSEGVGGGNVVVQYPPGHPSFLKPVNQKPYVQNAWVSAPTLPVSTQTGTPLPTLVSFANQSGTSADDPLNLHLTSWGYNPYMTVYQKGQWEKVGTRLPNQANSTAATLADLVTDFNALLTKLRQNGVMV